MDGSRVEVRGFRSRRRAGSTSKSYANQNIVALIKFFQREPRLNQFKGFRKGREKNENPRVFDPARIINPSLFFCVFNSHPAPAVVLHQDSVLRVKMFSSPFLGLVKDDNNKIKIKKNPQISFLIFFFFHILPLIFWI